MKRLSKEELLVLRAALDDCGKATFAHAPRPIGSALDFIGLPLPLRAEVELHLNSGSKDPIKIYQLPSGRWVALTKHMSSHVIVYPGYINVLHDQEIVGIARVRTSQWLIPLLIRETLSGWPLGPVV